MTPDAAVRRFLRVLDAENALLDAGDVPGAVALVAEKQAAADALRTALKAATLPAGVLDELRRRTDANAERLRLAMAVQSRILEMVAQAAVAARSGGSPGGYGRPGGRPGATASRHGPLALALRA